MDSIKQENFRVNQNALPPLREKKLVNDYQGQGQRQQTQPVHDRTSVSWMDQGSSMMNNTYLNNTSFYADKTLKSVTYTSLHTPAKVMNNLSKTISSNIWQTQSANFFSFQPPKTKEEIRDELMESKFLNKLNDSFENQPTDRDPKDSVGDESEQDYYNHYKRLHRVKQQNKYYKDLKDSAFTSMLVESEQKQITPCKLGIVKRDGYDDILQIDNRKIGDNYASMLSEGIKKTPSISQFHLKNNRITQNGSEKLIKEISKSAKHIDLAQNEIGRMGCQHLAYSLISKYGKIQYLNLEGNKLGDNSTMILLESVVDNKSLLYLNLSENFLTDKCKSLIANIIIEHPILEEVYLRWNNLKSASGFEIFQALTENKVGSIRVMDLSCNNLSQGPQALACAEQMAEFFQVNDQVVHLDISYNNFNKEQSQIISEGLQHNHTLYGIHYAGNCGYIDSKGFLIVEEKISDIEVDCSLIKHKIDGCKVVTKKLFRHHRDMDIKDCCWICQGWEEKSFKWTVQQSGVGDTDPLFIHFNFENFRPVYYGKQTGDVLEYNRMVPPGDLMYFFTLGTEDQAYAQDHPNTPVIYESFFKSVQMPDNTKKDVQIQRFNQQEIPIRRRLLIKHIPSNTIKPRTPDPVYIPDKKKKTRKRWTFPISLMYKWKPDNEEMIQQCFEKDWENSRVHKVVKNPEDLENVKQFLRSKYRYFRNTYKHYASLNPVGDIWGIQTAGFFELVGQIGIIDNKLVKDADINIKWTSVISGGEKGNPRNPVQAVNRHQFMEVWVRVAEEKYILKYKTVQTHFEAIQKIWEEHLEILFTSFDQQKWREERYWNEDCDYCLKHYKRIVEYVYKQYSKKKVKPGQAPFMCLDEIMNIINQANLQSEEHFGTGVYLMVFNQSMMTQVEELQSDRIFQMSITEFYEAIARIAEEASLTPMVGEFGIYPEGDDWTLEKRKKEHLGHKIEALIIRLYDTCTDIQFKMNIPRPEKSFFWKDPNESDFDYVD